MSRQPSDAVRISDLSATPARTPVLDAETARTGVAAGHLILAFQPIVCLSHGLSHRSQVQAGWRNRYGHPHASVLAKLDAVCARVCTP